VLLFRHQNPKALVSERSHRTKLPQHSLQEPQSRLRRHGSVRTLRLDQRPGHQPRPENPRLLHQRRRLPGFLVSFAGSNVKRKTDKDDALKLSRRAAINELKAVHMPSKTHREFRSLVKYRKTLDSRINKMKCSIRAWFVNHGISIDTGEKAWHSGRERINSFRKPLVECQPNELWKGELDLELTQFVALTVQLESVVKKLEALGKADPRIQRIRTIPGLGPRTAEIRVACIDDPHRFNNGREVSAYFGLVPRQYQSGETDRNGRITKRGNPSLIAPRRAQGRPQPRGPARKQLSYPMSLHHPIQPNEQRRNQRHEPTSNPNPNHGEQES